MQLLHVLQPLLQPQLQPQLLLQLQFELEPFKARRSNNRKFEFVFKFVSVADVKIDISKIKIMYNVLFIKTPFISKYKNLKAF